MLTVREAHARGMELHAWFNPYRAKEPNMKGALAKSAFASTHPDLVKKYVTHLWMDPGEPAVRKHTLAVVLDVVKRYDIDGVHLDDYFYPYPEKRPNGSTEFPDDASWKKYQKKGGELARDDWRRENVNQLVEELYTGIKKTKSWVKFGISPFGIWRPGNPETVKGFDAYSVLYADSKKWLQEGWGDYFTPQLYWAIDKEGQRYNDLLGWWKGQNVKERHLWPGNYTSKVGEGGKNEWKRGEVLAQIAATRATFEPVVPSGAAQPSSTSSTSPSSSLARSASSAARRWARKSSGTAAAMFVTRLSCTSYGQCLASPASFAIVDPASSERDSPPKMTIRGLHFSRCSNSPGMIAGAFAGLSADWSSPKPARVDFSRTFQMKPS